MAGHIKERHRHYTEDGEEAAGDKVKGKMNGNDEPGRKKIKKKTDEKEMRRGKANTEENRTKKK